MKNLGASKKGELHHAFLAKLIFAQCMKLEIRLPRQIPVTIFIRLGRPDSNQDKRIQSPPCYHCTTPQIMALEKSRRAVLYHMPVRDDNAVVCGVQDNLYTLWGEGMKIL